VILNSLNLFFGEGRRKRGSFAGIGEYLERQRPVGYIHNKCDNA